MKYEIYVGLNDKDAKVQLVSTKDASNFVNSEVISAFGFGTVSICEGIYTHDNGHGIVIETTIKIELMNAKSKAVKAFIKKVKTELNQETIGLGKSNFLGYKFKLV